MYSAKTGRQGSTIGDNVYYTLRKNIMDLKLPPGTDISIKEIAETLEVSRSPVRDAILKLSEEGLVDTIPQKGTMVSKIDLMRVEEERFLRESLEEKALLLCINYLNPTDIHPMELLIDRQKSCLETKDYHKFLYYDDEFHGIFFQIAGKKLCWELIQNMSGHYKRIRFLTLWNDEVIREKINQHEEILSHLCQKDTRHLTDVFIKHCSKLSIEEKGLLQKYPAYFKQSVKMEEKEDSFLKKDFMKLMK